MLDSKAVPASAAVRPVWDRLGSFLTAGFQVIAVALFLIAPFLAFNWTRTPYLGALVESTLILSPLSPGAAPEWAASQGSAGIAPLQITAAAGEPVRSPADLERVLRDYGVGDSVGLEVIDLESGRRETRTAVLQAFSFGDLVAFFFIPYGIGLVYLLSGLWVGRLRRNQTAGRAFARFATAAAVTAALFFDLLTSGRLAFFWTAALLVAGAGIFQTTLYFPQELGIARRWPALRWLPLLAAAALAVVALPPLYDTTDALGYAGPRQDAYLFLAAGVLTFLIWTGVRRIVTTSPIVRQQSQLILIGGVVSFLPLGLWALSAQDASRTVLSPAVLLPLAVFPLSTAYALMRYRFAGPDEMVRRGILYAALSSVIVALYILLVWGANLLFAGRLPANDPVLIGVMIVLLAVLFNPLRDRLQTTVDAVFFRGRVVYQELLRSFSQDLTQLVDLDEILQLVARYITPGIRPSRLYIFLRDPLTGMFTAPPLGNGHATSDLRFQPDSPLALYLASQQTPLFLDEDEPLPKPLQPERARLGLLGAQLLVPMIGRRQLVGWLALSARSGGEAYGQRETAYLDSLCDQAALAIQRAQVVADLQRRVHEMNVLGRVAQGINVTLDFDDILELIYAQTTQVIPAEHFRVTILDKVTGTFRHVFYLDGDERLEARENRAVPPTLGLEPEIIRGQRAINTEDYDSECRRRSVIPAARGLYAWMGVPLNAGTETIGALCLGSYEASVVFTVEQQAIVQAIADQAAGAIVKTQLLEESERRTRQLETLNQVARSLTLELEIDPLLNRIMESAVEIFNCEAGTLFLVDEDSGEIEFSVVVGGAEDLVGTRLAPGTGLVGKSVETRQPIIQNNVHESTDWFSKTDETTGFVTRGLLVVPMQVRDQVIGVIEVINKRDYSPFSSDDERLLSAFSAQAAIAVQNARLFTMTDQALAARVDELSVMQRIDRELNASLDLSRALHITLDWAMRQSVSDAGLVAVLEDGLLAIAQTQGYPFEPGDNLWADRLSALPVVQEALSQSQLRTDHSDAPGEGLLPEAGSRVAIPILRERTPIGLVFLERSAPGRYTTEITGFLNRLSDHAAIAIANARFYVELQEANIAKSDFISFVSHELKTPMTSIKGYADLLSAGAVGEINEAQSGFLATIRSNVNRMSSLVSDLADISRIEAGRLRLEFGAVSMAEIIEDVVRSADNQVEERGQTLELDLPEDLPPVWADRTRLTQILANLVSNALKYTPEGGSIRIESSLVEAREDPPASGITAVRVSVHDSGIGIRQDDVNQIFTKFFRSEDLRAREVPGTGLGLNITKNLVEMQGGEIWFETEFRKGSSFHFTVPIAEMG